MLREASDEDRARVLAWRNHPAVREASFTQHVIDPEEHAGWWRHTNTDPTRRLLVFERYGVPCGVVTFEGLSEVGRSSSAVWGYYLDVEGLDERGETLPAWIEVEQESLAYAFEVLGVDRLSGQVIADNTPVRRLHRRHGIREIGTRQREVDGHIVEFVEIEISADEWRARAEARRS